MGILIKTGKIVVKIGYNNGEENFPKWRIIPIRTLAKHEGIVQIGGNVRKIR